VGPNKHETDTHRGRVNLNHWSRTRDKIPQSAICNSKVGMPASLQLAAVSKSESPERSYLCALNCFLATVEIHRPLWESFSRS